MNDDFNTAKVMANLFEFGPVINSIKDKHLSADVISHETMELIRSYFKTYLEDIFGLKMEYETDNNKLSGVLALLMDLRKEARVKKDYVTSDKIRNQLAAMGIQLKDEKDGTVSFSMS